MDNFTVLAPMMLFGWIPMTIILFLLCKPHHAIIVAVLAGWLFLPMATYDLPGIPTYNKKTAISLGLLLGSIFSSHMPDHSLKLRVYDLPIIIWCICPIASSMSNNLGLYDGLSAMFQNTIEYGVPYFAARLYFNTPEALHDLFIAIIIAGIVYIPFCLYEIRMSPQLHTMTYGYFQHSFEQHIRYGGFRPIVFMQHGLMVSLWMAISTVITLWCWQNNEKKDVLGIPIVFVFIALAVTTLLCKSANGWAILALGICCSLLHRYFGAMRLFSVLIFAIPLYLIFRLTGMLSSQNISSLANVIFDPERAFSLLYRLNQEDLVSVEVLKRPLFGWGGHARGLPRDLETGRIILYVRDSLWLINFQKHGFLGLLALYTSMLLGPYLIFCKNIKLLKPQAKFYQKLAIGLSLALVFRVIDSLMNGMHSPLYGVISGALISFSIEMDKPEYQFDDSNML